MFKTRGGGSKAVWTMLKKMHNWYLMASLSRTVRFTNLLFVYLQNLVFLLLILYECALLHYLTVMQMIGRAALLCSTVPCHDRGRAAPCPLAVMASGHCSASAMPYLGPQYLRLLCNLIFYTIQHLHSKNAPVGVRLGSTECRETIVFHSASPLWRNEGWRWRGSCSNHKNHKNQQQQSSLKFGQYLLPRIA